MQNHLERDAAIKARMLDWQQGFHAVYDAHPPQENDVPRPEVMGDLGSDFRRLTGFSWLKPEAQYACIAQFPNAGCAWPRVQAWLGSVPEMTEQAAQDRPREAVSAFASVLDMSPDDPEALYFEMSDMLPRLALRTGGTDAMAAVLFLTELMYWQGSSYAGAHDVCRAVADPNGPNPASAFAEIEKGGWHLIWHEQPVGLRQIKRSLA